MISGDKQTDKFWLFNISDINECDDLQQNTCAQNCTDTVGSYTCSCREGFQPNGDKCDGMIVHYYTLVEVHLNSDQNWLSFTKMYKMSMSFWSDLETCK